MSVHTESQRMIGAHYRFPDYFEVGREKIREFARAASSRNPAYDGPNAVIPPAAFVAYPLTNPLPLS